MTAKQRKNNGHSLLNGYTRTERTKNFKERAGNSSDRLSEDSVTLSSVEINITRTIYSTVDDFTAIDLHAKFDNLLMTGS